MDSQAQSPGSAPEGIKNILELYVCKISKLRKRHANLVRMTESRPEVNAEPSKAISKMADPGFVTTAPRGEVTWVHQVIFFTGILSVAVAYITCLVILKVQGYYSRDINVPFFSDLGRDGPNFYIFTVGLSIAGISILFIPWLVLIEVINPKLKEAGKWYLNVLAYASVVIHSISGPVLPFIALIQIHSHLELHCRVAECYFLLTLITHLLQLVLYYGLYRSVTDECEWRQSVRTWGLRRAFLFALTIPYLVQTARGVDKRHISYDECLTRIEHTCPGITEASVFERVQKYPWRRKNGKALSEPYEDPIAIDEFERIPEGEPMEEIRVTSLQSYASCKVTGSLLTISQPICIFAMSLATITTFYFDFVFARTLQKVKGD